ncbi:alternative oxidase domain-containing protein [Cordyceps javanica]|nr:alternative oxidase domain-containing protein [Cordyceps javanica]
MAALKSRISEQDGMGSVRWPFRNAWKRRYTCRVLFMAAVAEVMGFHAATTRGPSLARTAYCSRQHGGPNMAVNAMLQTKWAYSRSTSK